jgi:hypothetical protein
MSAEQLPQPMPVCEPCFLVEHTRWEPDSIDEYGNILMKLIGVDSPLRGKVDAVDVCCMCGSITVAGIFEMLKPSEIYFSSNDEFYDVFEMSSDGSEYDEGF